MNSANASPLPGAIRQNAYVVPDLEAAIDGWLALGIGPWIKLPVVPYATTYRGAIVHPELLTAFANSGDLQIELIQQLDSGPSIYREFLDAGLTGFHHLAWWADDFDGFTAAASAAGWSAIYGGEAGGIARFAYFDNPYGSSTCIEVMELNDATGWMMRHVRDASAEWDGTDPIRSL